MATTIGAPVRQATAQKTATRTLLSETALRLGGGALLALAAAVFAVGTAWDIQWHVAVGRDKVLTSPHVLMLGGIAGLGLISLLIILLDTWRAARGQGVDDSNSRRLLRFFRAPVGLAVVGFGALLAAIAFPLDDYWHTIYGIDVALWTPFHVMLGFSVVLACLGVLYLFAGEFNRQVAGAAKWAAGAGLVATLASLLSLLSIYLVEGNGDKGLWHLGSYELLLYPVFLAFVLPVGLVTALLVLRLPGAATVTALAFLALREVMFGFVPMAMAQAVAAEGLTYRPGTPEFVIMAVAMPGVLLLPALLLDVVAFLARRSPRQTALLFATTAALSAAATLLERPWATILPQFYFPDMNTNALWWNSLPFAVLAAIAGCALTALLVRGLTAVRD